MQIEVLREDEGRLHARRWNFYCRATLMGETAVTISLSSFVRLERPSTRHKYRVANHNTARWDRGDQRSYWSALTRADAEPPQDVIDEAIASIKVEYRHEP